MTLMSSSADNIVNVLLLAFSPLISQYVQSCGAVILAILEFFQFLQNIRNFHPLVSVEINMRKAQGIRKLVSMKKDARLTIRIPKGLKERIDGIEQVYGVSLPKIANECFAAFCEYVEHKKQTPTFPIVIERKRETTHALRKSR
jgi:hypothetical protein